MLARLLSFPWRYIARNLLQRYGCKCQIGNMRPTTSVRECPLHGDAAMHRAAPRVPPRPAQRRRRAGR